MTTGHRLRHAAPAGARRRVIAAITGLAVLATLVFVLLQKRRETGSGEPRARDTTVSASPGEARGDLAPHPGIAAGESPAGPAAEPGRPIGDSTLTGHVLVHGSGEPVEGVKVIASRDLRDFPPGEVLARAKDFMKQPTTTSAADGSFRIERLPAGHYFVSPESRGVVQTAPYAMPSLQSGATTDVPIEVERTVHVRGRVVDSRGAPVEGANVKTDLNGTPTQRDYRTGASGEFDADDTVDRRRP